MLSDKVMKTNYILVSLAAVCALATGCVKTNLGEDLADIKVSKSVVALDSEAKKTDKITVTAASDWNFYNPSQDIASLKEAFTAKQNKVKADTTNFKSDTTSLGAFRIPSWVIIDKTSGKAGETEVTFSAKSATAACNQVTLKIVAGNAFQYINVQQGEPVVKQATCEEVNAGAKGATFKVRGTVESIQDAAKYGNWYIADETGHVKVYGTKDSDGATASGALVKYGVDVGDILTIEGPKDVYGGETELVDVTVLKIEKSLLKLADASATREVGKEGGDVEVNLIVKGGNLDIAPAADWIKISGISTKPKQKKDPSDTTVVTLFVLENVAAERTAEIKFKSASGKNSSESTVTLTQASGFDAMPLPYECKFENGLSGWTEEDITVPAGKTVWSQASYNSDTYAKGNVGSKVDCEANLVSPLIDLSNVTTATLSFKHAQKFAGDVDEEETLWASVDNGETWTQVAIPYYSAGNYEWAESGSISLNTFVGKKIKLAFKYKANASAYGTWEITNVKVTEGIATDMTSICEIASMGWTADKKSYDFSATLTDAYVTYVNGSNVFIQDATGGVLLYKSGHGLTAGKKINGKVSGKITMYGGFPEMTALDLSAATVTDGTFTPATITIPKLMKGFIKYTSCMVKIEGATLGAALDGTNRNSTLTVGSDNVDLYAKVKGISGLAEGTVGSWVCFPCYNSSYAKPQVGFWEAAHYSK